MPKVCQKVAVFLFAIMGLLFSLSVLLLLNLTMENFLLFSFIPPIAVLFTLGGIFFICRRNKTKQ